MELSPSGTSSSQTSLLLLFSHVCYDKSTVGRKVTTRYKREERRRRGTRYKREGKTRCRSGIHRRIGKEIGEQESQLVDGRSNVNCDPEEAVR